MKGSKFVLFSFALTIFLFCSCLKTFAGSHSLRTTVAICKNPLDTICKRCKEIALGGSRSDTSMLIIPPWLDTHDSIANDLEHLTALKILTSVQNFQAKTLNQMDSLKSNIKINHSKLKGSELNELINNNTKIMDLEESQRYYSLVEDKLLILLLEYSMH